MVGYRLSQTGIAKQPFFLKSVSVNVWSVEELCWFLHRYPALIDESIVSLALTRWLAEEFHITETAIRMERGLKEGGHAEDFLLPLFSDMNYLPPRELRSLSEKIRDYRSAGPALRMKRKADALTHNRRYGKAVALYMRALEAVSGEDRKLSASIHHNCGTALMQLLEYDGACAEFEKAVEERGSAHDRKAYLTAVCLAYPEEVFLAEAARMKADASLTGEIRAEAEAAADRSRLAPDSDGDLAAVLDELRASYHIEARE